MKLWSALPESASDLSEEVCDSEGLSFCTSRLCTRGWDLEKAAPLLLEIIPLEQAAASSGSGRETLDENGPRDRRSHQDGVRAGATLSLEKRERGAKPHSGPLARHALS